MANAPFPIPAHQTERADFRHSAFRPASPQSARRSAARCWCRATTPRHVTYLRLADTSFPLTDPDRSRCLQAHRQSPSPRRLQKHAKSQGPLLRRHYPTSTLVRPCPTPAIAVALRDVEDATLASNGSPPITRTTFPTCRAHYPGGSSGCACRLLPTLVGAFPKWQEGRIRIVTFEACIGFTLLRPAGSLSHKVTFITRLQPSQLPGQTARQLPDLSTIIRVASSSTVVSRLRDALPLSDVSSRSKL